MDKIVDSVENLEELTKRYDSQYFKGKAEYISSQERKLIKKEKKKKKEVIQPED